MIMKATLSNKDHPEYGVVSIPFPIPRSEYDHTIETLKAMDLGGALAQDCRVDEISSRYSILNRLVLQSVNVDELDYLAKRLESFCKDEGTQFQAMASKLCLSDIRDFINLTFCCQEATVITDFSDLERIGKTHSLTINGGTMIKDEFDKVDGQAVALDLLQSGAGVVTPYGIVYDNSMKLEAVVLMAQPSKADEVLRLAEKLDQFYFVPSEESPEQNSQLNELGYVAYHGKQTLEALMKDDPTEQHQQDLQMGGLTQ